ncbi:Fur family transcriptional regulator [Knoellia sp. CPCC 206435]|uniref:Fur family transcriptional regulator n=1 Tax=Knoellia terrae TaxID=3404797 RepID=UPI003B433FBE
MSTDLVNELHRASLRVTKPRLAVLSVLREHPHLATEGIISRVRETHGTVSHQAVYDVLKALTEVGLVRRIQPAGTTARYEVRVGDNHHHAVCRSCGAITDVECAAGRAPCLSATTEHGFVVDEAEVVFWGTCGDCATLGDADSPNAPTPQHPHQSAQRERRNS